MTDIAIVDTIEAVDLFAGGGGMSTGLSQAVLEWGRRVNLTAINHDKYALSTHQANHPWAKHILTEVQSVKPSEAVPEGRLDILVASPECTYHSRALGGKPKNDQSRSSAWYLERWFKDLEVKSVLVENVPEFRDWGPLDERMMPIKSRKGEIFRLWLYMFKKHGFRVEYRVVNAADYGDPTTRKRLFVAGRLDGSPITWPMPAYSRNPVQGMKKWRSAREIIEWDIGGQSIFSRKRPLSPNTMRRIIAGLKKFSSAELQPFIVLLEHSTLSPSSRIRDIDLPIPTITGARGGAIAVAHPFLLPVEGVFRGNTPKDVADPLGTITQRGYGALVESFIYQANNNSRGSGMDDPIPSITTNNKFSKIDAYLLSQASGGAPRSVNEPVPTIPGGGAHALIRSFLVQYNGNSSESDVEKPVPAVTTRDRFGFAESFLVPYHTEGKGQQPRVHSIDSPVPTVATNHTLALVQPSVVIDGISYRLEILYRMLTPRELARAQGFPDDYRFTGNRRETVKQIGNAVPVGTAKALISSLLRGTEQVRRYEMQTSLTIPEAIG